jgi:hypothetical protein
LLPGFSLTLIPGDPVGDSGTLESVAMTKRWPCLVITVLSMLVAVRLAGCASLPPEKSVRSINDIAGEWRGTIRFGLGPFEFVNVTINPDSTMVMEWGSNTKWGRVMVADGRASFDLGIWSGSLYYLEGSEKRVLLMKANFGVFDAQLTPLK